MKHKQNSARVTVVPPLPCTLEKAEETETLLKTRGNETQKKTVLLGSTSPNSSGSRSRMKHVPTQLGSRVRNSFHSLSELWWWGLQMTSRICTAPQSFARRASPR